MEWIEKLFPPEIRGLLETIAAIIEISAVVISAVLVVGKLLVNEQTGIPVIDKYNARKSLREMAINNETIRQFNTDTPLLVARAMECVIWFIVVAANAIIIRLLGYSLTSIDSYIRIFASPKTNSSVILHITIFIIFMVLCVYRAEPFILIAYPRLAERQARRVKGLFERAKLSAEEQEELTTRIGTR
jgi:hypothetical protein